MPEERTHMHDVGLLGNSASGESINKSTPVDGEVFTVPYPFVRDTFTVLDADPEGAALREEPTWKPGTRYENTGTGMYREGVACYADGIGQMVLTVVSVHRPGTFPTRVFFLREWITPEGKRFGKRKLRIIAASAFKVLSRGYRHEFEMAPQVQEAS